MKRSYLTRGPKSHSPAAEVDPTHGTGAAALLAGFVQIATLDEEVPARLTPGVGSLLVGGGDHAKARGKGLRSGQDAVVPAIVRTGFQFTDARVRLGTTLGVLRYLVDAGMLKLRVAKEMRSRCEEHFCTIRSPSDDTLACLVACRVLTQ